MYNPRVKLRKIEKVLEGNVWIDANGVVNELFEMEESHLRNVLAFLYRHKDRYWTMSSCIEDYENGESYFQNVIRKSNLYLSIIAELKTREGKEEEENDKREVTVQYLQELLKDINYYSDIDIDIRESIYKVLRVIKDYKG